MMWRYGNLWLSTVPSWQSLRCGLTAHMHKEAHTVSFFTKWLGRPDRFRDYSSESIVSRETGLKHLLLVAFLYADVESIKNKNWDAYGNPEGSCLRGNEEELSGLIIQWALASVVELEDILGPEEESDDDAGSLAGSTVMRGQFRDYAGPAHTGGVFVQPDWTTDRADRADRARIAEPVAGPSRIPTAASGTSRHTSTRLSSLEPIYVVAAREAPPDIA
ncbi:hypothetical protein PENSPDRAFT_672706 [Peniophora sp. CONT]|nr:hypothetical protein PENSPDRAFT_672706 [Peniophora sp. CONT]